MKYSCMIITDGRHIFPDLSDFTAARALSQLFAHSQPPSMAASEVYISLHPPGEAYEMYKSAQSCDDACAVNKYICEESISLGF